MSTPRVDSLAQRLDISNNAAKRLLRTSRGQRLSDEHRFSLPARGAPISGTGKPKGASH